MFDDLTILLASARAARCIEAIEKARDYRASVRTHVACTCRSWAEEHEHIIGSETATLIWDMADELELA